MARAEVKDTRPTCGSCGGFHNVEQPCIISRRDFDKMWDRATTKASTEVRINADGNLLFDGKVIVFGITRKLNADDLLRLELAIVRAIDKADGKQRI